MILRRIPIDGKLYCTKGKHWVIVSNFRKHVDGRLRSWCNECSKVYVRESIRAKRKGMKKVRVYETELNRLRAIEQAAKQICDYLEVDSLYLNRLREALGGTYEQK